jgi:hypothetical protein
LYRAVSSTVSCPTASSRPSALAPSRTRCHVGVRWVVPVKECWRVSANLTAWPGAAWAASSAATWCGRGTTFAPNPPPTYGECTTTLVRRQPEQRGQHVLRDRRALVRVVHRDPVVLVPDGDRGAGLDRVVEVPRGGVLAVDPDRRLRPRRVEVTVYCVRFGRAADDAGRAVLVLVVGAEERIRRYGVNVHLDQLRGQAGQFRRARHRQGHELAPEVHRVVLQHPQFAVGVLGQPAGVLVRDDAHAVVQREGVGGLDAGDPASGHVRPHRV